MSDQHATLEQDDAIERVAIVEQDAALDHGNGFEDAEHDDADEHADDEDAEHADDDAYGEQGSTRGLVIRHVLERQLVAGHGLSAQLLDAATNVSVAVAHAPAAVVVEIRGGATLPAAVVHTGTEVRGVLSHAGGRVRTAVGDYVGIQATLPNAVLVGAVDVTESVLRGQGSVAASAVDAVFTVASAATRGADLRDLVAGERHQIGIKIDAAREDVGESWIRARDEFRGAVRDYDEIVEALAADQR